MYCGFKTTIKEEEEIAIASMSDFIISVRELLTLNFIFPLEFFIARILCTNCIANIQRIWITIGNNVDIYIMKNIENYGYVGL